MTKHEGLLSAASEDSVILTTSEQGTYTIFGLPGEHRKAATELLEELQLAGHHVHYVPPEKTDGREAETSVEHYGVWPHLGEKAIAAMSSHLGVDIVDQRNPEVMRSDVLEQTDKGNVVPARGESRAA